MGRPDTMPTTWAQLVPAGNAGAALRSSPAPNGQHQNGVEPIVGSIRLCHACCSHSPRAQNAPLDLELLRANLGYGAQLEALEAAHARACRHVHVVVNALRCSGCGACVGREAQAQLAACGAVAAVAMALRTLLAAQPTEPAAGGIIPLALQSLAMLCMDCLPNGRALAEEDGAGLVHAVLSQDIQEPAVLAHACELLGAMFPHLAVERQVEVMELVATVAAGAAQRNHAAVACASSYALGMMVRTVQRGNMEPLLSSTVCSRALHTALVLLSSFPLQAGPLLKNCLGLVEVVAMLVPHAGATDTVHRAFSQMLDDAYIAILRALNLLLDPVSQVTALRCIRALLLHNPIQRLGGAEELVSWATRATSSARFNNLAVPRDAALIQVHGICLLAEVLHVDKKAVSLQSSVLEPEVHAALTYVASVACEVSSTVDTAPCHPVPDSIGVCLSGPLCPLNHESLTGSQIRAFASACAVLLHWHMSAVHGAAGVNSLDSAGTGILHKLSASGLHDALHAFLTVAGGSADLHLRDAYGNTPLQVAQNRGQGECAHVLALAANAKDAPVPVSTPLMNHALLHASPASTIVKSLSSEVVLGAEFGAAREQVAKPMISSLWAQCANGELAGTGLPEQQQLINGRLSAHDPVVECGRVSRDSPAVASPPQNPTSPSFTVAIGPGSGGSVGGVSNDLSKLSVAGTKAYDHWQSAAPGTQSDGATLMAALQQHATSANELATSPRSSSSKSGSAHTDDSHGSLAAAERTARSLSALNLGDDGGQVLGNGTFRVDTGMLSHLLGVAAGGADGASPANVPDWLSAGLAAAISTRNEAAAAIAAATAAGRPIKPEDVALLAEADQLLSLPGLAGHGSDECSSECGSEPGRPSKHLWLGNLNTKLPRSVLKAVFEHFGAVEDVVTFPGRMYAFVNFKNEEDAARAVDQLNDRKVPHITGLRKLVVKFRPSKKALGKLADGPGADAAAARAAAAASDEEEAAAIAACLSSDGADKRPPGKSTSRLSLCSVAAPPLSSNLPTTESLDSADLHDLLEASPEGGSQDGDDGCVVVTGPMGFGQKEGVEVKMHMIHATGSEEGVVPGAPQLQVLTAANASKASAVGSRAGSSDVAEDADVPEGKPSRHLWLGNIPLKPNKTAMELLFAQFGALESVRCFPGKTFAFVNFVNAADAIAAKTSLDGQSAPAVTGLKPLAIRFQKDTSAAPSAGSASVQSPATTPVATKLPPTPPATTTATAAAAAAAAAPNMNGGVNSGQVDARKIAAALLQGRDSMPSNASAPNLLGLAAVNGLNKMLDDDMPPEPAVNLSNRLNPNNVHYDKELAARYKRMNKAEKEALWAQDRAMQQMANSNAAAALLSASNPDAAARLLSSSLGVQQLAALATRTAGLPGHTGATGLNGNLAHLPGLADAHGLSHLLPRVMSTPALDAYIGSVAAAAVSQLQPALAQGAAANGLLRANSTHGLPNVGHGMSNLGGLQGQLASALTGGLPGSVNMNGGLNGGMGGGSTQHAQLLQQLQQQQQQQLLLNQLASQNALANLQQQLGLHAPGQQLNTLLMQQQQLGLSSGLNATGLLGLGASDLQQLQQAHAQAHVAAAHAAQLSQLAALSGHKQLPATFMCPLSRQVMLDPVVAADGVTYERSSITDWLMHNTVSPVTRQKLANQFLAPNYALKAAILGELGRGVQQGPLGMGGLGGL